MNKCAAEKVSFKKSSVCRFVLNDADKETGKQVWGEKMRETKKEHRSRFELRKSSARGQNEKSLWQTLVSQATNIGYPYGKWV